MTFASDLSFKSMKAALKRIFGEKSFTSTSNDELNSPHNIVKGRCILHITKKI